MPRGRNWVWVRVDPKIKAAKDKVKNKRHIRLRIDLLCGFGQDFEGIYRDIDVLSSATLGELHDAIFELFDRYDGHAWKFSFDTDDPYSREGRHYVPRFLLEDMLGEGYAAEETTLDSLNLKDGDTFLYLFDFGDDWVHEITVLSSSEASPRARKLWKLVKKQGKSPDQYPEDEEDYDDE